MNKVISVVKKWWMKVVSVICAALISFLTLHPYLSVVVLASGAGAVIGSILEWAGYVSSAVDILSPIFNNTPGALNETKFLCAWMDIIKDSGISEEDFKSYYTEIVTRSEEWTVGSDEYKTLLFIQDTVAAGVSLDAICYLAYHDTGTEDFTISEDNKPQVTGSGFKSIITDYSLMYAPMPTPSQYLYNYQSATGEKQTAGYYEFAPCAPLWRSGLGFGADIGSKGGWKKDCYVLPYIYDDDVGSTYYYSGYWHFSIEVDEFYKATYICDFVSLLGDEDSTQFHLTKSHEYRAYALKVSSGAWIQCFTSDTSYLQGNLALNTSYATVVNAPAAKTTYAVSGKLSDLVKNNFGNMLRATTFTPQTNTADDWGYIMSETPFELFKDQTSIDFSRIPNNYTITINGDTIYDYSITNPDTGDSTTIKKYIDDDYDFPQVPDVPDVPDPGDDSGTGGKVEVSGKIDVSGKVDVDVNVNVNSGSSSNPDPGDYINPGTVDTNLDHYLEQVPELSKGFIDYLKDFFAWLPDEVYGLIILGLVVVIFCRLAGR